MTRLGGIVFVFWLALVVTHIAPAAEPVELQGHTNVVSAIEFSPDGKQLVSSSWDRTIRVWNVSTRLTAKTLRGHRDWVFALRYLADSKSLTTASQKTIRRWDMSSGMQTADYGGLGGAVVNSVALSADAAMLITGGRDGKCRLWRVGGESPVRILSGFESWISSVAISPNNDTVVAATRTGQIRQFDLKTGKEKAKIAGHPGQQVMALAINPDSGTLASGSYDQTVRLWELASGKEVGKLTGHQGLVTAIAWSADGRLIASGERHGSIHVWDTAQSNRQIAKIAAHKDKQLGFSVTALAFSPDGRRMASGGYDHMIRVWTLPKSE